MFEDESFWHDDPTTPGERLRDVAICAFALLVIFGVVGGAVYAAFRVFGG